MTITMAQWAYEMERRRGAGWRTHEPLLVERHVATRTPQEDAVTILGRFITRTDVRELQAKGYAAPLDSFESRHVRAAWMRLEKELKLAELKRARIDTLVLTPAPAADMVLCGLLSPHNIKPKKQGKTLLAEISDKGYPGIRMVVRESLKSGDWWGFRVTHLPKADELTVQSFEELERKLGLS